MLAKVGESLVSDIATVNRLRLFVVGATIAAKMC
jgi:hypothetical protein